MQVSTAQSLEEVRKKFHLAVIDPNQSCSFHQYIHEIPANTPTLQAYQAVAEAMIAQNVWNPFAKLNQLHRFHDFISEAILTEPENIEIRFLRFAVEFYTPRILSMSDNLLEDRDMILENLKELTHMNLDPDFALSLPFVSGFSPPTPCCDCDDDNLLL